MLDTALFVSPYSALGMSLDLAASRWAIWAICGSARETAAGVCTKIQLLPQPHAMGPVLGQRAKHAKCSLFNPASTKLFALSHHFSPPGPGIEPGTFGSKVRPLARSAALHALGKCTFAPFPFLLSPGGPGYLMGRELAFFFSSANKGLGTSIEPSVWF